MKQNLNLCMGCMSPKDYSGPCEICGYLENTAYLPRFLAPGTELSDRYIVGKMLSFNGEGALYIGYDTKENETVELREYLPDTLCTRKKNTENVIVNDGCLPLYKSYLSEFAELYKAMMNNNESESIRRVYGIFAANNTGYVVMEHLDGCTLEELVKNNGGKLSWDGRNGGPAVKEMLPPLLTTLNMLHSQGIIHRGLSPESICADERGRLRLTSFGTSASRTEGSSITCELFSGYAAPEQYEVSERQGTWTDIYGICAVMYYLLTGVHPLEANSRELNDVLEQPYFIDPAVPRSVSDTIMAGMRLRQDERIQTINELVERLFTQPRPRKIEEEEDDGPIVPSVARVNMPSHTSQTSKKTPPRRKPQQKSKKKKEKEKSNIGTILGVSVFLAIVAGFIIAIVYFSQASQELLNQASTTPVETFSPMTTTPPETTAAPVTTKATSQTTAAPSGNTERILMPDFSTRFYNMLEKRYPMLKFNPTYEYNNDYAEGIIFEQDIEPGTEVTGGTEINVKVSKGPESVPLPDYIGMKLEDYTAKLSEAGIKYDTEPMETGEVKEGYVAQCSKEIGESVLISRDEKIIVYYAVKPPETTTKKTKPPKTTPPEEDELNPDDIEPEE